MTAPSCKRPITPEMVERFAAYHRQHDAWGVLHVSFDDGNWWCEVSGLAGPDWTDEERELARIHDMLTESQRRRLCGKAQEVARRG